MRAAVLNRPGEALVVQEIPAPRPNEAQVLIHVHACAVCRTDLHIVAGELPLPPLPIVPGHQIIGTVVETGSAVTALEIGQRVGVPWLGWTCGECSHCRAGCENLCERARFTGYDLPGGFAEYVAADAKYCFSIPDGYSDAHAAPLLCAGLIGYRCLRFCGAARSLGIYGFGAAAHIVTQIARWQERAVYAFARPGDDSAQTFALQLGAVWAGASYF